MQIPKPDKLPFVPQVADSVADTVGGVLKGVPIAGQSAADAAAGLLNAKNSTMGKLLNGKAGSAAPFPPLPAELHATMSALSSSTMALSGGLDKGIAPGALHALSKTALEDSSTSLAIFNNLMSSRAAEKGSAGATAQMDQLRSTSEALMHTVEEVRAKAGEQLILHVVLAVVTAVISVVTAGASVAGIAAGASAAVTGTAALIAASVKTAANLTGMAGDTAKTLGLAKGGGTAPNQAGIENYFANYEEYLDAYSSGLGKAGEVVGMMMDAKDQSVGAIITMMQSIFEVQQKLQSSVSMMSTGFAELSPAQRESVRAVGINAFDWDEQVKSFLGTMGLRQEDMRS